MVEAKKTRRAFTIKEKLEAINYAKANSKREASRISKSIKSALLIG